MMNIAALTRMRWLLGTLLIVAAALFAMGVSTEGDVHHETVSVEAGEHNEATEQAEHNGPEEVSETGEEILGINLESTPLIVLAVIISLVLAAATWRNDHKLLLLVIAMFAVAFAVLDIAEFSHQIQKSAATVAAIAATIAVLHAVAALLAEQRRAATP